MSEKIKEFLKPRLNIIFLTIFFVIWEYVYGYRGIDFELFEKIRGYFGFGLTVVNWDNFLVRTFSMGIIWIIVAFIIFTMLWLSEAYVVSAHNRRITRKFINQPKEDFAHLLKTRQHKFKTHFIPQLWNSAFLMLIFFGMFLLSGIFETIRMGAVISYVIASQDPMSVSLDFNSTTVLVVSFLATAPFWYLYSCFDLWCLRVGRRKYAEAKIEDDHYAVVVEEDVNEDEDDEDTSDLPQSHVV